MAGEQSCGGPARAHTHQAEHSCGAPWQTWPYAQRATRRMQSPRCTATLAAVWVPQPSHLDKVVLRRAGTLLRAPLGAGLLRSKRVHCRSGRWGQGGYVTGIVSSIILGAYSADVRPRIRVGCFVTRRHGGCMCKWAAAPWSKLDYRDRCGVSSRLRGAPGLRAQGSPPRRRQPPTDRDARRLRTPRASFAHPLKIPLRLTLTAPIAGVTAAGGWRVAGSRVPQRRRVVLCALCAPARAQARQVAVDPRRAPMSHRVEAHARIIAALHARLCLFFSAPHAGPSRAAM